MERTTQGTLIQRNLYRPERLDHDGFNALYRDNFWRIGTIFITHRLQTRHSHIQVVEDHRPSVAVDYLSLLEPLVSEIMVIIDHIGYRVWLETMRFNQNTVIWHMLSSEEEGHSLQWDFFIDSFIVIFDHRGFDGIFSVRYLKLFFIISFNMYKFH